MKTKLLLFFVLAVVQGCMGVTNLSTGAAKPAHPFTNLRNEQPVTTSFYDADTSFALAEDFQDAEKAEPLFGLTRTTDGGYILTPGFYEGEFKSYCLHPGTHGPASGDGYLYAPLKGSRKDVIETILRKSEMAGTIPQRDIQLLIWAVLAKATFRNLSSDLKWAATELLTPKQLYDLNGGALGLLPELASAFNGRIPGSIQNVLAAENKMRQLFLNSGTAYAEFERLAVLDEPSKIDRPEYKRGRWCRHPSGYFIRFFPNGYQRTTIQVYVPADSAASLMKDSTQALAFYPSDMVAMPANSEAQRIGIGGPWGIAVPGGVFRVPFPRLPEPGRIPKPRKTKTPAPAPPPADKGGQSTKSKN